MARVQLTQNRKHFRPPLLHLCSSPLFEIGEPASFPAYLRDNMRQLKATPVRVHTPRNTHIHKDLSVCTRIDRVYRPLQAPYDGPYRVLERANKFTLDSGGCRDTVSLDHLKPASEATDDNSLLSSTPAPIARAEPTQVTRSGRRVHFPERLMSYTH